MASYYNEIEPYPAQWLRNLIDAGHIAPGYVDEKDIRKVQPNDIEGYTQAHFFAGIGTWSYALRLAGWPDDRPVWTGSCPCQPFSSAGKRGGTDDPRHLWPEWFRLIRECRPPVVFGEQVASKDGLAWLDLVYADLEGAGYAVAAVDLCAAGAGAPHIRQRLYFVAHATGGAGAGVGGILGEDSPIKRHEGTEPAYGCGNDGLAHTDSPIPGDGRLQRSGGQLQPAGDPAAGTLGDAASDEQRRERQPGQGGRWEMQTGRSGTPVHLGNTNGAGLQNGEFSRELPGKDGREPGRAVEQPGASFSALADAANGSIPQSERGAQGRNGHGAINPWEPCEWLSCRDGKARPTQPGLQPLAHGAPARVGRLRTYGNAIVPQLAAEFIAAYMELER